MAGERRDQPAISSLLCEEDSEGYDPPLSLSVPPSFSYGVFIPGLSMRHALRGLALRRETSGMLTFVVSVEGKITLIICGSTGGQEAIEAVRACVSVSVCVYMCVSVSVRESECERE